MSFYTEQKLTLQDGLLLYKSMLDENAQLCLLQDVLNVIDEAPLFVPRMPRTGKAFSVNMTNSGDYGWVSDIKGYRYQTHHPDTCKPWPAIPDLVLDVWNNVSNCSLQPQACLINWYDEKAKMGLHQDKDENMFDAPVVSISLGQTCRFRYGGQSRKDKTASIVLESGDVLAMGGYSRLAFHGVDRILAKGTTLLEKQNILPQKGRLNLTLRRVTE